MSMNPQQPGTNLPNAKPRMNLLWVLLFFWVGLSAFDYLFLRPQTVPIPYSQFTRFVSEGRIASVDVGAERIQGVMKNPVPLRTASFTTNKVEDPGLTESLASAGVEFRGTPQSTFWATALAWIFPIFLILLFWRFIMARAGGAQGQLMGLGRSKAKIFVERDLKTRFTDVAGTDEGKQELQELVQFLKNPTQFGRLGGRMPKGVLLVGPPGTGKTLLARAVAGEAGVPFFSINGSEFVELFVGLGAARVRDLFEQARKQSPCIIFIDELDALGRARGGHSVGGGANDEKEQTLNQLLAELDGFDPSTGLVLLAATNRPEVLDPALMRSGRFDRQILVDKPDRKGRLAILNVHVKKVKLSPNVDLEGIAALTAGFSGADLANLVNEAALVATRRDAEAIELRDFNEGVERIIGGLERKSRVLSPEEKKRVAYHEMGHASASLAMGRSERVHKVSVIPRGIGALGYTMRTSLEDRYLMNRDELEDNIAILLGGRAAEMLYFEQISTGASDDLDRATDLARSMVTRYGMSERVGPLTYDRQTSSLLGNGQLIRSHDYSESTALRIDEEVRLLVERGRDRALTVLQENTGFIEECVMLLLDKETLEEAQLKKMWDMHQASKTSEPRTEIQEPRPPKSAERNIPYSPQSLH